ncbi:cytochrome oxidase subunit I-like [Halarchaeum acidiphilum MH1-52-1]|uniref:Cytochrome oxidase subunit I-like n=1 Tax=Halarchaeum acidiphilum MH1-52-1 TaxID=1261545 RepID=U2YDD5_9EURY|nr:archaeosortase A [Halarchaeum acidiphilum]GAD51686.1 cytochrome oxidase subunit I-like [Halarchaeum acidiphilum MH1-52-1]
MALETTDALAWIVVGLFAASAVLATRDDYARAARSVAAVSWVLFGVFWALLVPHFWFAQKSVIETILVAAAVPGSLYVAYLVYGTRPSLMILSRAVAAMGIIYLPVLTIDGVGRALIAATARESAWLQNALGYHPRVLTGPTMESSHTGFPHAFVYVVDGHRYLLEVLLACTGIGSISLVAGVIIALRAPLRRRLLGLGIAVPVIYALNVVRVSFIAMAHGNQWFDGPLAHRIVAIVFSPTQSGVTSYYIADRVIAQSLSVVALVALTIVLLRVLPELGTVVRDLLYLATGTEYDVAGRAD